jgi:Bacterial Ig domain
MMPRRRIFQFVAQFLCLASTVWAQTAGTALVTHAPELNGSVIGSIQQMSAEGTTLNGGASVNGDLLVPGTPAIRINGHPTFAGTLEGGGATTPTNYTITLNGNSSLQHVVLHTDPIALQVVAAPPAPSGTRDVAINNSGQSPGDFTTIRNLTLNGNAGTLTVPAGTYGALIANGSSSFLLGIVGGQTPSVYNLQSLTLNGSGQVQVVGPVVINVKDGPVFNGNVGSPGHAAWLALNVAAGGLTLNGNAALHGYVAAPNGIVTVNGSSVLDGGLQASGFTVNGGGVLQLVANQPPTIAMTAPDPSKILIAPANVTLTATATDADGTVASVAFYNGGTKLGDAQPVAGQPSRYSLALASPLTAGTYAFSAQATDNLGATTTSPAVTVLVDSPPTVSFTPPPAGTIFASPAMVTIAASATPGSSTITKVEVYRNGTLVATLPPPTGTSISFTDPTPLAPGSYTYSARIYDALGVYADSAPIAVSVLAGLPYLTDFESADGYVLGSLAGQFGWAVPQGSAVVTADQAYSGSQSALLSAATPPTQLAQTFAPLAGQSIVFVDFFAKPVADTDITASTIFDVGGARFALARNSAGQGELRGYNGDGQGGGTWQYTSFTAPLATDGSTQNWVRLTARLDFAHATWDLYANGTMVAAALGFRNATDAYLSIFTVTGDVAAGSRLDYLFAGPQNPLFADVNNDGIDDAWESAHGLDLTVNDRNADPDGDGLTNVQEYIGGTDPTDYFNGTLPVITSQLDASGQAGPTGFVSVRVTTPTGSILANAPLTFSAPTGAAQMSATPGGAALTSPITVRTDSQGLAGVYLTFNSFTPEVVTVTATSQGLSNALPITVNPPLTDSDDNGLPDLWELTYFGKIGNDPGADPDHDGLTNLQEYQQTTDPTDYYNGVLPQLQPLGSAADQLAPDGSLNVLVTNAAGQPLVNAPGNFKVKSGGHLLSASANGPWATEVQVNTDANGKAKVYVKAGTN